MILSGNEIKRRLNRDIFITDFDESRLGPNSYNLRLGKEMICYQDEALDMKRPNRFERFMIPDDGMVLIPGKLYLGCTKEFTQTFDLVPMLEGRSSVGRLGLFIHVTAGFGDVGFCGYWTLEMHCIQPIKIYPDVEICQIYYHTIEGRIDKLYRGKYQNANRIEPSSLYKEWGQGDEWIDNADSYICRKCRFETDNPMKYPLAKCPICNRWRSLL